MVYGFASYVVKYTLAFNFLTAEFQEWNNPDGDMD